MQDLAIWLKALIIMTALEDRKSLNYHAAQRATKGMGYRQVEILTLEGGGQS